jgi:hypothetical protein
VRRILSFALGLGIGLVVGGNLVRRLDAVQQRFAPDRIGVAAAELFARARERAESAAAQHTGRGGRVGGGPRPSTPRGGGPVRVGDVVEHPTARRAPGAGPWTR